MENQQKILSCLVDFGVIEGGSLIGESIKKGKFVAKIFL